MKQLVYCIIHFLSYVVGVLFIGIGTDAIKFGVYQEWYFVAGCLTMALPFVYFQNSCDQDYDYKEWGDISYFRKQIEFIDTMSKEQFIKWYKENIDDFFEQENSTSDIDYYKRSAVYELCYQPIEKVVWGNDNCIVVNLLYEADYSYINYKNILKRFLIQKAEKEDWVRDYLIQCGIIKQGE